MDMDTSMGPFD